MKKILLGLFIVFLVIAMILDTNDYVLGNNLTDLEVESEVYAGKYADYEEASSAMDDAMVGKFGIKASYVDRIFKLPNNHYYTLKMMSGDYKRSQYLYTGFIENLSKDTTELTFPENEFNLVNVNGKYEEKSWDVKSKAGVHHFQTGPLSKATKLEDEIEFKSDRTEGIVMSSTLKDGVIQIDMDGIWLDKGNNKIGMNETTKTYATEAAAVNAVKKDEFGQQIGVLKTENMNFYVFKNIMSIYHEYTVIPVRIKDNQYYAGKYERFTFMAGDETTTELEEQVEGVTYKLNFQQNLEKAKQYRNQIKEDQMQIAVQVRGEDDGK